MCLLFEQRQGLQICVVIYHLDLPPSMIVAIEQITWNQLHWLKLLHASYIFLWRQAGKGRVFYLVESSISLVFYSADKCFETGADPRNTFDKQLLKVWTPCLSAFYCAIPRATLAWSLKACAIARFSNQRARGQKTIGKKKHDKAWQGLTSSSLQSMAELDEISRVQRPFSSLFLLIFLIYLARALAILCKLGQAWHDYPWKSCTAVIHNMITRDR